MEDYGERIRRAKAQIEQGNIEEAAELLDRLDSKFGITDLSCYARAEISLAQEEYNRAQKWLGKVENRSQGRWYEYMEMVLGRQDTEAALAALEELYLTGAEELPDNGHLQYMAGLVKLSRGNNQEAAYCFRRAGDLGEEKGLSCYYMGLIRYELGDGEAAFKYFEEALKQGVDQEKEDNILWYMERLGVKE